VTTVQKWEHEFKAMDLLLDYSLRRGPGSSKSGLVQVFDAVREWSRVGRAGHGYEQPIFTSCRIDLNG
jgi:hypothetical protein